MKLEPVKCFGRETVKNNHLHQILHPVRHLTKIVLLLPEWVNKPDHQFFSIPETIFLTISATIFLFQGSMLVFALYSFVYLFKNQASVTELINPLLWMSWNCVPFATQAFIVRHLKRLPEFFHLLTKFTNSNPILQQYPVPYHKKFVIALYITYMVIQLVSVTGLTFFMIQYPHLPPLLTSIVFFRNTPWCHLAMFLQFYSGMYASVGLLTADLGTGFLFYYLSLQFRALTLYSQESFIARRNSSPSKRSIISLCQAYEEILCLINKAESLFGPMVLGNQLSQLGAATVFTYTGMRHSAAMTPASVTVYISNAVLSYFRAVAFNALISKVHNEHGEFQQVLARLVVEESAFNFDECPKRKKQYMILKDLLNRAQNHVVAISPYKLYTVTPRTLCAMCSTIVAYLVILLQLK